MTERSRLKVGIDVPWVTRWSSEAVTGVGPCDTVEGWLAVRQADSPEMGRPIYSMNHFRRQRESVRAMLCPMCGQATRHGDRWTQTGKRFPAGVLRARGLGPSVPDDVADAQIILDAGAVAPGHRACMARALKHCPHLRAEADRELKPFPKRWTVTPAMVEATLAEDPAAQGVPGQPRRLMVIAFLQLCGVTSAKNADWRRLL